MELDMLAKRFVETQEEEEEEDYRYAEKQGQHRVRVEWLRMT